MKKRYLTFFILSNDTSRSRQFRLPVNVLKGIGAFAAIFVLVMGFVAYDYTKLKRDATELYNLRKENTSQKIELQGITAKVKDLESQVAKLMVFDKKLRIIANLDKGPADKKEANQVMGIGGKDDESAFTDSDSVVEGLVSNLNSEIDRLKEKTIQQESSFTELQSYLTEQSTLLASMPSIWPAKGWITSNYGERTSPFTGFKQHHQGIDIANRVGTPVYAPGDGIVLRSGWDQGLGKTISIRHGMGVKTEYGHLSEIYVKTGQRVRRGDRIGAMGNTGRSTGPHLHYAVSVNDVNVNPSKYILN